MWEVVTQWTGAITVTPGRVGREFVDSLIFAGFDGTPLVDGERPLAFAPTPLLEMLAANGGDLTPQTPGPWCKSIGPEPRIDELLRFTLEQPAAIVLDAEGNNPSFFTLADLNRHPGRGALYPVFAELEAELALLIDRSFEDPWGWLELVPKDRRAGLIGYWEISKRDGTDIGPIAGAMLSELGGVISKHEPLRSTLGFVGRGQWEDTFNGLNEHRHSIMHTVRPLVMSVDELTTLVERVDRLVGTNLPRQRDPPSGRGGPAMNADHARLWAPLPASIAPSGSPASSQRIDGQCIRPKQPVEHPMAIGADHAQVLDPSLRFLLALSERLLVVGFDVPIPQLAEDGLEIESACFAVQSSTLLDECCLSPSDERLITLSLKMRSKHSGAFAERLPVCHVLDGTDIAGGEGCAPFEDFCDSSGRYWARRDDLDSLRRVSVSGLRRGGVSRGHCPANGVTELGQPRDGDQRQRYSEVWDVHPSLARRKVRHRLARQSHIMQCRITLRQPLEEQLDQVFIVRIRRIPCGTRASPSMNGDADPVGFEGEVELCTKCALKTRVLGSHPSSSVRWRTCVTSSFPCTSKSMAIVEV
jgi:hypothetical protein